MKWAYWRDSWRLLKLGVTARELSLCDMDDGAHGSIRTAYTANFSVLGAQPPATEPYIRRGSQRVSSGQSAKMPSITTWRSTKGMIPL